MNDLEALIESRIKGTGSSGRDRDQFELDFTDREDDGLLPVIALVKDEMVMMLIPTQADEVLLLEIHSFVDGNKVGQRAAEVRRKL